MAEASRIGRSMDRDDERKAAAALERSPDDRATSWHAGLR
jgi:hypothetical protein